MFWLYVRFPLLTDASTNTAHAHTAHTHTTTCPAYSTNPTTYPTTNTD
jgi:hypothetical protein